MLSVSFAFLSDSSPIIALTCHSLNGRWETWLMWPWRVRIHATSQCLTSFWQTSCWHCNKTKVMLLMPEQNKSHFVGAGTKRKPCWILFNLVLSKLIYGFLYVVTRTCQSDYMDLLKLLCGFVQVVLRISWPLSNKTKLKFDQDFKACWSCCSEPKVLNESKYSMPWSAVPLAIFIFFLREYSVANTNNSYMQLFQSQGGRKCPHFVSIYKRKNRKQSQIRENIFVPDVCPLVSASRQTSKWQPIMAAPPLSLEFVKSAKIIGFSCPTESLPQFILYSGKS